MQPTGREKMLGLAGGEGAERDRIRAGETVVRHDMDGRRRGATDKRAGSNKSRHSTCRRKAPKSFHEGLRLRVELKKQLEVAADRATPVPTIVEGKYLEVGSETTQTGLRR